ncbi:MAG: LEA type 2 family protein [Flavobacteriaceae bacterium]|nr:LEA type 2 family protein [Flavobacteriaceae bacterium]
MRKTLILLTTIFTVFSCKVKEKPLFVKIENIKVKTSTPTYLVLNADAFFLNPNDLGGTLKSDGIKISVNNNEIATVSSNPFKVPAKEEFSIPLEAKIPLKQIISDKNISGLIGSLFSQKINVKYKGNITYKALGFSYEYPIDIVQDVKIKL